jgi:hypothetical protein
MAIKASRNGRGACHSVWEDECARRESGDHQMVRVTTAGFSAPLEGFGTISAIMVPSTLVSVF